MIRLLNNYFLYLIKMGLNFYFQKAFATVLTCRQNFCCLLQCVEYYYNIKVTILKVEKDVIGNFSESKSISDKKAVSDI